MKTKWILGILAGLMICSVFSASQGADKFYYGTYYTTSSLEGDPAKDIPCMSDSLRFNIVAWGLDDASVEFLAAYSMRAIASNADTNSPGFYAGLSHYTLWEAEGLPGSYYNLQYHGGKWIWDPSASGDKARVFSSPEDSGIVQTGPYYEQDVYLFFDGDSMLIEYTAEFRLKSPLSFPRSMGGNPPRPLCKIMAVNTHVDTILAESIIYESAFENCFGYKTFKLLYKQVEGWRRRPTEFWIEWYGKRSLFVDYVKVYDRYGQDLIDDPEHIAANKIKAWADTSWAQVTIPGTDETVVYRWYLKDEIPLRIDLFEPHRFIDGLLHEVNPEFAGTEAQHSLVDSGDIFENEYLLRRDPEEFHMNYYPGDEFGMDQATPLPLEEFQQGMSTYVYYLNLAKTKAEDHGKDFWSTIKAHGWFWEIKDTTCCPGCSIWYYYPPYDTGRWYGCGRVPTPYEVRVQTFLSLCYGANAVLNFWYHTINGYYPSVGKWRLTIGLVDRIAEPDSTTARWREIRDFTGPRVEVLGPLINQLTWEGACLHENVSSFVLRNGGFSYIDSIVGKAPESTYVEVGFFEGSGDKYFMLVNRRCLEGEDEILNVYFNFPDGPYYVTDMFTPEFPDGKICGVNPYTIALEPGEGRLFKLEKFYQNFVLCVPERFHYICFSNNPYPTIQEAIDAALHYPSWITTILVDTGTYYENIDFKGKNLTVTSKFHLYPSSPEYISQTIIDGSMPADSDSASVVRFISGESPCATLKGFTIRNGTGTIYIDKGEPGKYGGGIYCKDSSPTIINNVIMTNNVNSDGGGIYCRNSSPQILNNMIKENTAGWYGGGIAIYSSDPPSCEPILSNNLIIDNTADYWGGGVYYRGNPFIINNTFDSNTAASGGGIFVDLSDPSGCIENNIITNSLDGGGIRGYEDETVISYNDVWNNTDGDFEPGFPFGVGDICCVNRN